ncbi:MAG: ACP S-malonyltransferase [Acidimicrobiales bacterium]
MAFTFPGQGSQRPGMGRPWLEHPSWEIVRDASEAVGRDLAWLLCEADAPELTQTRHAQLATFSLSLVVLDAVERLGLAPSICAGHSLGEYSALVASGAVGFEEGARLVAERGEAMQDAADASPGRMVALLGISDDDAEVACQRAESDVLVANYNAPGQVVIAGTDEGVEAASALARELGARKIMALQVSGAFHTPLIVSARRRLRKALAEVSFSDPEVPVVSNVDARFHGSAKDWPGLLSAQLCSPVRWRQTLELLGAEAPTAVLVEVGASGVLTGLARRCLPGSRAISVSTPADLDHLVESLAGPGPLHTYAAVHQGENLYVSERVVVSPAGGVFEPKPELAALPMEAEPLPSGAQRLSVGELVGVVGDVEVRSPFAGSLMGLLAHSGERVTDGQPLAWLRTAAGDGS